MEVSYNTEKKQLYRLRKVYKAIKSKQKLQRLMLKELYRLFLPKRKNPEYHKKYSVLNRQAINEQVRLYIRKRKSGL